MAPTSCKPKPPNGWPGRQAWLVVGLAVVTGLAAARPAWSAPNQATWNRAAKQAQFSARMGHSSVVFNNRMWVIGGNDHTVGQMKDDVWSSGDGQNWQSEPQLAPFGGRTEHVTLVFQNKLWLIGGNEGNRIFSLNDVWSSPEGKIWTMVTRSGGFPARDSHSGIVFNNRLWIIGGFGSHPNRSPLNDVWSSADGYQWQQETESAQFPPRSNHTSVVFNNRMWVIGGSGSQTKTYNDVWSSADGRTWRQETKAAQFLPRLDHVSLVWNNRIWLIGGWAGPHDDIAKNDVWSSADGQTWTKFMSVAGFAARHDHSGLVFQNKLWVIGGFNHKSSLYNDVWWYDPK